MLGADRIKTRMEFNEKQLKFLADFLNAISDDLAKLLSEDSLNVHRLEHIYFSLAEAQHIFEIVSDSLQRDLRFLKAVNTVR